ncbi:MAG: glycosyltransferase, partial [Bdellovibrionales bacterium]|nr:glycosyltransferase [Bdellovibrionales bacterium]
LVRNGRDVKGITRWGFPLDLQSAGFGPDESIPEEELVGEVPYLRMSSVSEGYGSNPLPDYLRRYEVEAAARCRKELPILVHAASNFMNGVVVNALSRRFGIPSIYEVRGLWEVTRLSRQPNWEGSDYFRMQVRMETEACKGAASVIAITSALKREMVRRGVEADKITVIPNGVDSSRFVPLERNTDLASQLGVEKKTVIGYIGSVVDYEGLPLLVDAVQFLAQKRRDFHLLIVGDGATLNELKGQTRRLGLEEWVTFTGRVPHEEVESYYSITDILCYPRKGVEVCEMVSPMKPFEAMAMEKAVICSNVDALTEIIKDGQTGILHKKDDVTDLTMKLSQLIDSETLRKDLGKNARKWVQSEREWDILGRQLNDLYKETIARYFARKGEGSGLRLAV